MVYAALADVRSYLGVGAPETADDALLTALIARSQGVIDRYTGRTFEASTQTRYFLPRHIDYDDSSILMVDTDLLTVTTLRNGDDAATIIPDTDYWLWPFAAANDGAPYWGIKLKAGASQPRWDFGTDGRVQVAGTWGYSATAPDAIKHATIRLAGYLYRQRDSQVFEATADPVTGQMTIPPGMPKDVRLILDGYRRLV